ncbi:MAG: hypothetical protein ACUVSP_10175 [Desulfotomaculales bacterium]
MAHGGARIFCFWYGPQAIFGRHGPHAVAVIAPWGAQLGYLRASLAAILAPRYARGEVFAARVAAVMGPDYDPNDRLYIEVWRETVDG